jgi:enoyl-CoA hydratase/carnithine racemase
MPEPLLVENRGHTTIFTLNRPERRNAYDDALTVAIKQAMLEFDADPDQYVGVLTGAGDLAFCSGSDLGGDMARNAVRGHGRPNALEFAHMYGVGAVSKPMIAAVNGLAVGGGFELALNCDIRIASDRAWFALFEPRHGMVAGVAVQLLPRIISHGDAAWILLTGERVTAAEAHRMGVVQRVVPHESLLDESLAVAATICELSQLAVQTTKRVMGVHRDSLLRESVVLYEEMMARLALSPDRLEGIQAFREKRAPDYRNRWPTWD